MFTLSNALSLLRAPLALLFLICNPLFRSIIVVIAMLTDIIDGYLARRYKYTTRLGAVLDPLMDKFFVFVVVGILFSENALQPWQLIAILSRDIALFIFAVYVLIRNQWKGYNYRSMWWGKVTTSLQFPILFLLSLGIYVPVSFYTLFYIFGCAMFFELFLTLKSKPKNL